MIPYYLNLVSIESLLAAEFTVYTGCLRLFIGIIKTVALNDFNFPCSLQTESVRQRAAVHQRFHLTLKYFAIFAHLKFHTGKTPSTFCQHVRCKYQGTYNSPFYSLLAF